MSDESRRTDGDESAPLARVRRAKARQVDGSSSRRVDGGAVAVGLVPALGAKLAAALATLLSPFAGVPAVASTLVVPLGGYVAGRYAGAGPMRAGLHGALVAVLTLAVTMLGAVAVAQERALSTFRTALVADVFGDTLLIPAAVALVVASGVAGVLAQWS